MYRPTSRVMVDSRSAAAARLVACNLQLLMHELARRLADTTHGRIYHKNQSQVIKRTRRPQSRWKTSSLLHTWTARRHLAEAWGLKIHKFALSGSQMLPQSRRVVKTQECQSWDSLKEKSTGFDLLGVSEEMTRKTYSYKDVISMVTVWK